MTKRNIISRTVWLLSCVSLCTDLASEMLYPIMPVFLKEIGFSVLLIGALEGCAEATAGLSKSYFGRLSDLSGKRLPFVRLGYLISAVSKPLMAVTVLPVWILFSRTIDRLGKGIRTSARDAMLSDEATPQTKGRVFGLHRSMDTLGAVAGPALAMLYLYFFPGNYRTLFLIAFLPGMLAVAMTFVITERKQALRTIDFSSASPLSVLHYWKSSPPVYRKLVAGLLAFALVNSSDLFLLLKIKDSGLDDISVIGIYIFYNLVYAAFAYPLGQLADHLGFKRTFIFGIVLFAVVYGGISISDSSMQLLVLFALYGIYAAATESVAKAWITNITSPRETATAIGTYTGLQSICTLIASTFTGWTWLTFGSEIALVVSAALAVLIAVYIIAVVKSQ